MIDGTFWLLLAILGGLCGLAWQRGGSELLSEGLASGGSMLLRFSLVIVISFLAAGLAERLVPQEWMSEALGDEAGIRGIFVATGAGILTPAGPFVSLPIAAVMLRSGASHAAVVAYLASWGLLAAHRFVAWEVPILGFPFASVRWAACLLLPILVGLAVRVLTRATE